MCKINIFHGVDSLCDIIMILFSFRDDGSQQGESNTEQAYKAMLRDVWHSGIVNLMYQRECIVTKFMTINIHVVNCIVSRIFVIYIYHKRLHASLIHIIDQMSLRKILQLVNLYSLEIIQ